MCFPPPRKADNLSAMLARKEQNRLPNHLPETWATKVKELLQNVYAKYIDEEKKKFDVLGLTYPDEFLLVVSLQDEKEKQIPVTYLASYDITKENINEKTIDKLLDSVAIFFDGYFQNSDEQSYSIHWSEANHGGIEFFYKVTRENVRSTLLADQMLSEDN